MKEAGPRSSLYASLCHCPMAQCSPVHIYFGLIWGERHLLYKAVFRAHELPLLPTCQLLPWQQPLCPCLCCKPCGPGTVCTLCFFWAPAVCSSLRLRPVVWVLGVLVLLVLTSAFHSFSEEERTRFRELLASPSYRASPLLAIGRQLAHQMQLEGGDQL